MGENTASALDLDLEVVTRRNVHNREILVAEKQTSEANSAQFTTAKAFHIWESMWLQPGFRNIATLLETIDVN